MPFLGEFDHLKINLQDIKSATDNFGHNNVIGRGGFGPVYKGELSLPTGRKTVAFKRLDRRLGQGNPEFYKEIMMLSKYKHENLVSLMHYCIEGDEMILVYEYAPRGSLDRYVSDVNLTWSQRLKICVGVARAINFLHDPAETHQRLIHRDIKSSNILLDDKWTPKVSDFGLSKAGPANQPHTYVFSNAVGTPGYCDPLYFETGFLSKESDVYSFGVVFFELMCGRLCFEYRNGRLIEIFVNKWRKCYEEKRFDEIIFCEIKEEMQSGSLSTFSRIAYRCINKAREERPTMVEVVKELEIALEQQEVYKNLVKKANLEEMVKLANQAKPPLSYATHEQLFRLLLDGIFVDDGTTWLSLNKNGEICEMVSATKCVSWGVRDVANDSRFSNVVTCTYNGFKVKVFTRFLTPHVPYTINIVFKINFHNSEIENGIGTCVSCSYKLDDDTHYLYSSNANMKEGGWLVIPLYQFTSNQKTHHFNITIFPLLLNWQNTQCSIEGVEFRPVENETHEDLEHKYMKNKLSTLNSHVNWEQKMPADYAELIRWSPNDIQPSTKKELYSILRKGFLIENGEKNFCQRKNGYGSLYQNQGYIALLFFIKKTSVYFIYISVINLLCRFEVVAESRDIDEFRVAFEIKSKLLSPQTTYSCHLIYKPPENRSTIEGPIALFNQSLQFPRSIYLIVPHIAIIGDQGSRKEVNRSQKIKGHPKVRKDGWMEVELWEGRTDTIGTIGAEFTLNGMDIDGECNFVGLVIQGIELRPL